MPRHKRDDVGPCPTKEELEELAFTRARPERSVELHIRRCPACLAAWIELRRLYTPPPDLRERVLGMAAGAVRDGDRRREGDDDRDGGADGDGEARPRPPDRGPRH